MTRLHSLAFALLFTAAASISFAQTPTDQAAGLIEQGQFLAAERLIESLATAKKPDARALHQLSQIRVAQHQSEEAIKLSEKAVKLDSTKAEYFLQLSKALSERATQTYDRFLTGRIRKALEQSVKLDPDHLPGLVGLVRFYSNASKMDGGDLNKARDFAERVTKLDPIQGEVELGNIYLIAGKPDRALAHFEKAIATKPDHALAHYYSALALAQLDKKAEARTRLQRTIALKPAPEIAQQAAQLIEEIDKAPAKP